MSNKGLIVLSGGQDSTITALFARKECHQLHAITFDYGQKHKIEIKAAVKISKLLNFKTHEIIKIPNILKSSSPLINRKNKLEKYFEKSIGTNVEKLQNFAKYVPRQNLTTFLTKYEIFKKILDVPGSIIECGVLFGGGLMTFAQLSAIFEHVNFERQIIGFDTFSGFPSVSSVDKKTKFNEVTKVGEFATTSNYEKYLQNLKKQKKEAA